MFKKPKSFGPEFDHLRSPAAIAAEKRRWFEEIQKHKGQQTQTSNQSQTNQPKPTPPKPTNPLRQQPPAIKNKNTVVFAQKPAPIIPTLPEKNKNIPLSAKPAKKSAAKKPLAKKAAPKKAVTKVTKPKAKKTLVKKAVPKTKVTKTKISKPKPKAKSTAKKRKN